MSLGNMWANLPEALTNEETCALIREGSEESLEKALIGNLRLVRALVSRHISNLQDGDVALASLEDMEQECVFNLMKSVRSFDPDRGVTFATFASRGIMNVLGMEYRRQERKVKPISLETKVFGTKRKDDDGVSISDTVPDPKFDDAQLDITLENFVLREKILPILSQKEREIFIDFYFRDMTKNEIALNYNMVRTNVVRYLGRATEKVKNMLKNGITEDDLALRKVSIGRVAFNDFVEKRAIIKKFGEDFLRRRFLPKLTAEQATIFKNGFLRFYGQPKEMLSLGTRLQSRDFVKGSKEIKQILQQREKELLAEKEEFDKLPIIKVVSKEVRATNALVEKYGGRAFLWKYFLPILKKKEKQVFVARVLNFDGSLTNGEIAKTLKMDVQTLKKETLRLVNKLAKTDLELVNELIDNSICRNFEFDINQKAARERKQFLQKFGSKGDMIRLFNPTLNKEEKQIFKDFYLFPIYIREDAYAKSKGWSEEEFALKEKEIREKLQNFDFAGSVKQADCPKAAENKQKSKNKC